jgi:hypothetical protein
MTTVELKVRLVVGRASLLVVEVVELVVMALVWLEVVLEGDELSSVALFVLLVVMSGMLMDEKVLVVELEVLEAVPRGAMAGYAATKASITTAPTAAAASSARVFDLNSTDIGQAAYC